MKQFSKRLRLSSWLCMFLFIGVFFKYKLGSEYLTTKNITSFNAEFEKEKTDAVILFTKMRSGSSIVGSIFNKRSGVTYLYEPLFPYGEAPCDRNKEERLQILYYISTCQFERLGPLYQATFRYDKNANCRKYNVCFVGGRSKFSEFITRDAGICRLQDDGANSCPEPIDPAPLDEYCKKSLLRAMKVIYLCKLEWLLPLLDKSNLNIKVIHLVRDPRSTISSRNARNIQAIRHIKASATFLCENLVPNVAFGDILLNQTFSSQKFMRIRFEDFVWDPIKIAQQIFDFVGVNMTDSVTTWLEESISPMHESHLSNSIPDGLHRNPTSVLNDWRKKLPFEHARLIQKLCYPVLKRLGYEIYDNEDQYRYLKKLHFTPFQ